MSELGKKLKSVREEKGITLQEVGLAIKISPRIISSIESGEKSGQPAKTFLRGFVKSYAQYLKMDTVQVLQMFDDEYQMELAPSKNLRVEPEDPVAIATKIASPKPTSGDPAPVKPAPFPSFPWGKALLAGLLFVGIVILAKVVHKYQRERDLPTNVVVGDPVESAEQAGSESPLTPVLDPGAPAGTMAIEPSTETAATGPEKVEPEPSPTATPTPAPTATPTPTPTPAPTATPTPSPTPSPTPKPTPSPSPSPTASPSPTPTPATKNPSAGTPFEVVVEASKPISVTFDYGNGKVSTLELARGGVQIIKSRTPIGIEAADSAGLTVFVNGRAKALKSGEPLKLRIPE